MAESTQTVSPDTLAYLDEVKKGKPRKYVLLCKGMNPVSLVVYKKGNVEKYRKEAKEMGKGQFYFGIVQGKGMDITFCLARADGFETVPIKNSALKGYLEENGFKCKPNIALVDVSPQVWDESDPLVQRYLAAKSRATATAVAAPAHAEQLQTLVAAVPALLEDEATDRAVAAIVALEAYLAQCAPQSDPPQAVAAPTASPSVDEAAIKADPRYAKLSAALLKLKPAVAQVIAASPKTKSELTELLRVAVLALKGGQFETAQAEFIKLAKRLKELAQASPVPSSDAQSAQTDDKSNSATVEANTNEASQPTGEDARLKYERLLADLEPRWLTALDTPSNESTKLRAVMGYVQDQADASLYDKACSALARLEALVNAVLDSPDFRGGISDGIAEVLAALESDEDVVPGVVAFRKLLLQWQAARDSVAGQLENLRDVVEAKYPEHVSALVELDEILNDFNEELDDALIDLINAPTPEDVRVHANVVGQKVDQYLASLNNHVLVAHVDTNPFIRTAIKNTLGSVLTQLRAQLNANAAETIN